LGNRTARQCRERYKNYLAPSIRIAPWTPEEDALLLQKYRELGPKWSQMTSFFGQRSAVSLKNHYVRISQHFSGDVLPTSHSENPPPKPDDPSVNTLPAGVVNISKYSEKAGESWFNGDTEL
jgi:hypothetical protein